jgi:hypothetical protein
MSDEFTREEARALSRFQAAGHNERELMAYEDLEGPQHLQSAWAKLARLAADEITPEGIRLQRADHGWENGRRIKGGWDYAAPLGTGSTLCGWSRTREAALIEARKRLQAFS